MDKLKVGNYLKNLRKNKRNDNNLPFTQNDLADAFIKKGVEISINAIKEWENGKTLPTPDKLELLSEIYDRSIDEILDGEDKSNIDLKKEYFLFDENWGMKFAKEANLYQIRNEQILKITTRFKELIMKLIEQSLSNNEERELKFLFLNFYSISDCVFSYITIDTDDDYLLFMDAIRHLLLEIRNMTPEEKWWEIQKLYHENGKLWFNFRLDVHDLKYVDILQQRFSRLECWQKDMLLAMFQNLETYGANADKHGSSYLERYERENGEFEHDQVIKNEIAQLIKNGACLNKLFLNHKVLKVEKRRIIDRLEELYNLCLKPIIVSHRSNEDGEIKTYKIENNLKNRFIKSYYFALSHGLKSKAYDDASYNDLEEIYEFFVNTDEFSDELRIKLAQEAGIDTNRDRKYWIADYEVRVIVEKSFLDFKAREKEIADGLVEIKKLEELLNTGEKEYKIEFYESIGGNDEDSIRDYIERTKIELDYDKYLKGRDKKSTKLLLKDLNELSLKEIKEKYFKEEVF